MFHVEEARQIIDKYGGKVKNRSKSLFHKFSFILNYLSIIVNVRREPETDDLEKSLKEVVTEKITSLVSFRISSSVIGLKEKEYRRYGSLLLDTIKVTKLIDSSKFPDSMATISSVDDSKNSNAFIFQQINIVSKSASSLSAALAKILIGSLSAKVEVWCGSDIEETVVFVASLKCCGEIMSGGKANIGETICWILRMLGLKAISNSSIIATYATVVTFKCSRAEPNNEAITELNALMKDLLVML